MPPKSKPEDGELSREGEMLVSLFALMIKNGASYNLQELTQMWTIQSGQTKNYNTVKAYARPWIAMAKDVVGKCDAEIGTTNEDGDDAAPKPKAAPKGRKKAEGTDLNKTKTGRVTKSKKKAAPEVDEEDCDLLEDDVKEEVDTEI